MARRKNLMVLKQAFIALPDDKIFYDNTRFNMSNEQLQNELRDFLISKGCEIVLENASKAPEEMFQEFRFKAFGASDSAVLLGVAFSSTKVAMKTINELIDEKIFKTVDSSIGDKASVRKGKELEPLLIEKFSEKLGTVVLKPDDMYGKDAALHTNFDGVIFERATKEELDYYIPIPLEIKLCTVWGKKNYDWTIGVSEFAGRPTMLQDYVPDIVAFPHEGISEHIERNAARYGVPKYYYTQLQQQMYFLDAPHGYVGVMDDAEWTIYLFKVKRDERVITELKYQSLLAYNKLAEATHMQQIKINLEGDI
jgi:hypothetical protein